MALKEKLTLIMAETCLCERCTALCCRYFALQIDEPQSPQEFDDVRWYLAHENVHIFVEDGDWYLSVQTKCQHLEPNNQCGIYEDRPKICRTYSTENCDYHAAEYDFEQYFTSPGQLEAYAQATLGERYKKYAMKQRLKNLKLDKDHPDVPKRKDVLATRVRGRVKGHPSQRRPGRASAGATGAQPVALSIGAVNPAEQPD